MVKQLALRLVAFALFPIAVALIWVWAFLYLTTSWFSILTHGVGWDHLGIIPVKTERKI